MRWLAVIAAFLLIPSVAFAACEGEDWRDELAPETMREIRAHAAEVPFHEGIAFEAVRGETRLTLFGTVHVHDPGVFVPDEIAVRVSTADLLLVEVASDVMADFDRQLAANPALLIDFAGPGLKSRLTAQEWDVLLSAFSAMGIAPDEGDKLYPWIAALLLEFAPCDLKAGAEGASILDDRVEALAREAGVAVGSLDGEPEELVSFFTDMSEEEQLDLLRLSLAAYAADGSQVVTLVGSWNDEEIVVFWEVARARAVAMYKDAASVEESIERIADYLLASRNRDWMTRIMERSRDARSIVIAVGAMHLPAEDGLLRLLEREGFAVRRLAVF